MSVPRRKSRPVLPVIFLAVLGGAVAFAVFLSLDRPWIVPPEAHALANPVPEGEAALQAAASLYREHCQKCHGEAGRGDGVEAGAYSVSPPDFTDVQRLGERTDGELFYKMTVGRRPMPAYEKQLTAEQRWRLVHLIRTFGAAPDDKPQPPRERE